MSNELILACLLYTSSSLTYADLQTYQFLDNPQHVALELRGGMPEDQMTQILVAESQEKALKNVTVISCLLYTSIA